jgi:hypothetical protein
MSVWSDRESFISLVRAVKSPSKQQIDEAAHMALEHAKEHYKDIVHILEKHLKSLEPDRRLGALYLIDAVLNRAQHKLSAKGKKNPFPARFEKNLKETVHLARQVGGKDAEAVKKVLKLWEEKDWFSDQGKNLISGSRSRRKEEGFSPVRAATAQKVEVLEEEEKERQSPVVEALGFDYGDDEDDSDRIQLQKRRLEEEKKRLEAAASPKRSRWN